MSTLPPNKPLHLTLFLATCASTWFVFFELFGGGVVGTEQEKMWGSALYAGVVMLILSARELGRSVMARAHGIDVSLPYFIPFPLGFGTMGAVTRVRGKIPSRNALVDFGAAGSLAALLIAVPMLFVGVALSSVEPSPATPESAFPPSFSLLNLASMGGLYVKHLIYSTPMPVFPQLEIFGDNLLSWLAVKLIHGEIPAGSDVMAHPVFIAAWFGLLVTMINLLPVGELDGGHLTFAWHGEHAEAIGRRLAGGALILALVFNAGWLLLFLMITRVIGVAHQPVVDPSGPLSRGRKVVVLISWLLTALVFMPNPLSLT
jgi:membrane-associated protease RseP (regulator of RpoE activity)